MKPWLGWSSRMVSLRADAFELACRSSGCKLMATDLESGGLGATRPSAKRRKPSEGRKYAVNNASANIA